MSVCVCVSKREKETHGISHNYHFLQALGGPLEVCEIDQFSVKERRDVPCDAPGF